MEIGEEGRATVAKSKMKLAIEDYLEFIDNRDLKLSVRQLYQIVGMHGFKKKIEGDKSLLIDAVKTMDLMDLHRSTLQDGDVLGDGCLTLKKVINDLKSLQWHECHITSLITLSAASSTSSLTNDRTVSVKEKTPKASGKDIISTTGTTVAAGSTTTLSMKGNKSKGLEKKPIEVVADDSTISTKCVAAGSTTVSVKGITSEWLGMKKTDVEADNSIISTRVTTVSSGSTTTVSMKGKKSKGLQKKPVEVGGDDSIISTKGTTVAAGSTIISVKGKKSKGLEKKMIEAVADDSLTSVGTTAAAGSTTASGKRKRLKGLGMKPVEVAVDPTMGTTIAAGSTTEGQ